MSNFETLFNNNSEQDIQKYYNDIQEIRKNNQTRQDKINSVVNQVEYMNLMNNIGKSLGGNEKMMNFKMSKDLFDEYDDNDVDYLFDSLNVPNDSNSKDSILTNIQNTHNIIKYLNLSNESDSEEESEEESEENQSDSEEESELS